MIELIRKNILDKKKTTIPTLSASTPYPLGWMRFLLATHPFISIDLEVLRLAEITCNSAAEEGLNLMGQSECGSYNSPGT